jgi:hypothetical protein
MDDRTVAYVIASQPAFDDLRQVAAQLAGLLVLAATGSKESTPDHPMLAASRQVLAKAEDGVKSSAALVTDGTRPHYAYVAAAVSSLRRALVCAESWPIDVDAVLAPLRDAYDSLQQASSALPGFQIVSFDQACCSVTGGPATNPQASSASPGSSAATGRLRAPR